MTEKWLPIAGMQDRYEISNLGRIRSIGFVSHKNIKRKPRLLKLSKHKSGYLTIRFSYKGDRISCKVHRLVALHFIVNSNKLPQINHIDGVKTNNCVSNLEWVTNKENFIHAKNMGLLHYPEKEKSATFKGKIEVYNSNRDLVDCLYGVKDMESKGYNHGAVYACLNGKRKHHRGYTYIRKCLES